METPLRVHIIPVADDEIDRIVRPAELARADRIYLIHHSKGDLFENILNDARSALVEKRVVQEKDIRTITCDFYDLTRLLQEYAGIIKREQERGNLVYFNVSTGGKLNSVSGMLSCMLFGGIPYFCKKDFAAGAIPDPPEILELPQYSVERPSLELVQFLIAIDDYMRSNKVAKISKGECIDLLKEIDSGAGFTGKTSSDYNRLKFRFLDKLSKHNYIKVETKTRGKIAITKTGRFVLDIYSIYYNLRER